MKFRLMVILLVFILGAWNIVYAGGTSIIVNPTALGPYKIGHTTMLLTDPSRNPCGVSIGSSCITVLGITDLSNQTRPIYIHLWYPSSDGAGPASVYTESNPLYDGNHPGYGLMTWTTSIPSPLGARDNIRVASGKFPLLIFSHGFEGSGAVEETSIKELLTSYGFIVAGIDHTAEDSSLFAAFGLGLDSPVMLGVITGNTPEVDIPRAQDISSVISNLLKSSSDPRFAASILSSKIGVFGYSEGGSTTMMSVAGLQSSNYVGDSRIKAAIAMSGTDNGDNFSATDYANVRIPIMLFDASGSDTFSGVAFPQLVNSLPKYYVDISGAQHIPLAIPQICNLYHQYFVVGNSNLLAPESGFFPSIYSNRDVFDFCGASLFSGINNASLLNAGVNTTDLNRMLPLMPLRKQIPLSELERLTKWYVVSFFNTTLKGDTRFAPFLTNSFINQVVNPLVDFAKNCRSDAPSKPLLVKAGDKITFTPAGFGYFVKYSTGNSLLPEGSNKVSANFVDHQVFQPLPFSFSIPGFGNINAIDITQNGAITTAYRGYASIGSPWEMLGEIIFGGEASITPLMNDFLAPAGAVYADIQTHQAIITWDSIQLLDGSAPSTFQVVIHDNGTIDMIYGQLAGVGPDFFPNWLGQIGIATGKTIPLLGKLVTPVDFTKFTNPTFLPMLTGAIVQQFYISVDNSTCPKIDE